MKTAFIEYEHADVCLNCLNFVVTAFLWLSKRHSRCGARKKHFLLPPPTTDVFLINGEVPPGLERLMMPLWLGQLVVCKRQYSGIGNLVPL